MQLGISVLRCLGVASWNVGNISFQRVPELLDYLSRRLGCVPIVAFQECRHWPVDPQLPHHFIYHPEGCKAALALPNRLAKRRGCCLGDGNTVGVQFGRLAFISSYLPDS